MAKSKSLTVRSDTLRVSAHKAEEFFYITFEHRGEDGWQQVAATGADASVERIGRKVPVSVGDPIAHGISDGREWRFTGAYNSARLEENGKVLVLESGAGGKSPIDPLLHLTKRLAVTDHGTVSVAVRCRASGCSEIRLGELMSCLYFTPGHKGERGPGPLEFAWIPALHWDYDGVVGDHVFRSPAAIMQYDGYYAALVPDLDLFSEARPHIRHALDLRLPPIARHGGTGADFRCARLYYGFCTWEIFRHVYYRHANTDMQVIGQGELSYGYDLFIGRSKGPEEVTDRVNKYLWNRYGHEYFKDIRPQVLPFEEYGRKYAYVYELPATLSEATVNGRHCAGINNPGRRGANYHAWENDLVMTFGIRHYGEKWKDGKLIDTAKAMRQMLLCSPTNKGAFRCIYNFDTNEYEGTLHWTAMAGDPFDGYDTAAMGVTAWWAFYHDAGFGGDAELVNMALEYAELLADIQLPSGAVPTFLFSDLSPSPALLESGTTAISGAVLAKAAMLARDAELKDAALAAGMFVDEQILPRLRFHDFETFYSCSPKPCGWVDPVSGIEPQNNLAVQWAADQFLALYRLTEDTYWLERGEYVLGLLSFYHQVWSPPHYPAYLFGGFGVMNTDGEWNDGRQSRFSHTYADFYEATGNLEYLERAVASCRASFTQMDIKENHANEICFGIHPCVSGPGTGKAGENLFHSGPRDATGGWTGFNWSAGGALTASADLERRFGSVWVDGKRRRAVPVDGLSASVKAWKGTNIELRIAAALDKLPHPYTKARRATVKFGRLAADKYDVTINSKVFKGMSADRLAQGVLVSV